MKSDKLEVQKRTRIVQEWILADETTATIVSRSVEMWGVCDRQAFRYLDKANEGFVKILEKDLEKSLGYHIQRRKKLIQDMNTKSKKTPAGIAVILDILEDIAKLEKLYTTKIELTGKDGQPLQTSTTTVIIENPNSPSPTDKATV